MAITIGRIDREGRVIFGDASVSVWEEGLNHRMSINERDAWELQFKRQVFKRVIQCLNRIGWTVGPWDKTEHYQCIALSHRTCHKGDLEGELSVSGRHIEFKMWQNVANVENPNGGRHDFYKEKRMPYVLRLEMERTRRRIREYLLNVFTGYEFDPPHNPEMGLMGLTALEKAAHDRRTSGHYKPELDRAEISMSGNAVAADGGIIEHGARVWARDYKGRIITGTAYYSLNSNWQIVTGRYGLEYHHTGDIFTRQPEGLRVKRNQRLRRKRLEQELKAAVERMDFRRAEALKNVLFPSGPLYAIYHKGKNLYFDVMYCGYRDGLGDAGRYTRDELKPYLGDQLENDRFRAVPIAA